MEKLYLYTRTRLLDDIFLITQEPKHINVYETKNQYRVKEASQPALYAGWGVRSVFNKKVIPDLMEDMYDRRIQYLLTDTDDLEKAMQIFRWK